MKTDLPLLIISLVIIFFSSVYEVNFFDYKAPVPHSNWESIDFTDFRGIKKPSHQLYGQNEFAYVSIELETKILSDTSLSITTFFHPSRSYVFQNQLKSDLLLKHELYHFHTAEYAARMLRKKLSGFSSGNTNSVEDIIEIYKEKEDSLQHLYDKKTYHGSVMNEQVKWQNKIDSCLNQLSDFKETSVVMGRGVL